MGRLLHIGMIVFLGISFIFSTCFLHNSYKNTVVNGKSLLYEPVNKNVRTDKMGIGEIFVYVLMFIIAILFAVSIIHRGRFPSATAILIRTIILVPIMALFNARKRMGKAVVTLFASLLFLLFCIMTYIIIGLPVKAPILTINNTEIRLGKTTIKELMDDGFDIYIEKERTTTGDYEEFLSSKKFEKYSDKMDIFIPKGYHRYTMKTIPYSKGILASKNTIIAEVIFYGSMTKETHLKDCSIIYFRMKEKYISKAKDNEISIKLNGIDLFSELETTTMKKTFGKKFLGSKILWKKQIEADKHYLISWDSNSYHLFYNSYTASIYMDDNYFMNSIEFTCEIAREAD